MDIGAWLRGALGWSKMRRPFATTRIDVDGRIRSTRVIEVLARLVCECGAPLYLHSDNGPEFVSRALLKWITEQGIETALIDPGKPWKNGATESFNGKFRDKCLSLEWFRSRAEAKVVIETWRRHYNEARTHSSLGHLTPAAFAARLRTEDAAPADVTGWSAAYLGFPRPAPSHHRPARGIHRKRTRRSTQAKTGSEKRGRSNDDSGTTLPRHGPGQDLWGPKPQLRPRILVEAPHWRFQK
jgi:putative transposase